MTQQRHGTAPHYRAAPHHARYRPKCFVAPPKQGKVSPSQMICGHGKAASEAPRCKVKQLTPPITLEQCAASCLAEQGCKAFSYTPALKGNCFLARSTSTQSPPMQTTPYTKGFVFYDREDPCSDTETTKKPVVTTPKPVATTPKPAATTTTPQSTGRAVTITQRGTGREWQMSSGKAGVVSGVGDYPDITLRQGDKVTFKGQAGRSHWFAVAAGSGHGGRSNTKALFDQTAAKKGQRFTTVLTFDAAGDYVYYCPPHDDMVGRITVEGPTVAPTVPPPTTAATSTTTTTTTTTTTAKPDATTTTTTTTMTSSTTSVTSTTTTTTMTTTTATAVTTTTTTTVEMTTTTTSTTTTTAASSSSTITTEPQNSYEVIFDEDLSSGVSMTEAEFSMLEDAIRAILADKGSAEADTVKITFKKEKAKNVAVLVFESPVDAALASESGAATVAMEATTTYRDYKKSGGAYTASSSTLGGSKTTTKPTGTTAASDVSSDASSGDGGDGGDGDGGDGGTGLAVFLVLFFLVAIVVGLVVFYRGRRSDSADLSHNVYANPMYANPTFSSATQAINTASTVARKDELLPAGQSTTVTATATANGATHADIAEPVPAPAPPSAVAAIVNGWNMEADAAGPGGAAVPDAGHDSYIVSPPPNICSAP